MKSNNWFRFLPFFDIIGPTVGAVRNRYGPFDNRISDRQRQNRKNYSDFPYNYYRPLSRRLRWDKPVSFVFVFVFFFYYPKTSSRVVMTRVKALCKSTEILTRIVSIRHASTPKFPNVKWTGTEIDLKIVDTNDTGWNWSSVLAVYRFY